LPGGSDIVWSSVTATGGSEASQLEGRSAGKEHAVATSGNGGVTGVGGPQSESAREVGDERGADGILALDADVVGSDDRVGGVEGAAREEAAAGRVDAEVAAVDGELLRLQLPLGEQHVVLHVGALGANERGQEDGREPEKDDRHVLHCTSSCMRAPFPPQVVSRIAGLENRANMHVAADDGWVVPSLRPGTCADT
jgi:hypothetical protein